MLLVGLLCAFDIVTAVLFLFSGRSHMDAVIGCMMVAVVILALSVFGKDDEA